jgi:hypothetical protein
MNRHIEPNHITQERESVRVTRFLADAKDGENMGIETHSSYAK